MEIRAPKWVRFLAPLGLLLFSASEAHAQRIPEVVLWSAGASLFAPFVAVPIKRGILRFLVLEAKCPDCGPSVRSNGCSNRVDSLHLVGAAVMLARLAPSTAGRRRLKLFALALSVVGLCLLVVASGGRARTAEVIAAAALVFVSAAHTFRSNLFERR
jgi:hypothetical protein